MNVRIGLGEVQAHQVSPALFALGDEGEIGLRILDKSNKAVFQGVRIIEDGPEGVWVTGLPDKIRMITVGQGFVRDGESVEVVLDAAE